MDFLTIDMVKTHCHFESYDPNPERQAEIDDNIKMQANKAEQEVYEYIGRNYSDIIKVWKEVPLAIIDAALVRTYDGYMGMYQEHADIVRSLLRPYKKKAQKLNP